MGAEKNDGGPAFPKPLDPYPNMQSAERGWSGMSLRDWFAGQVVGQLVHRHRAEVAWSDVAPLAYRIADAMLAARGQ